MTDRLALRRKLGLPDRVEPKLTEEERIIRQFEERMAMGCAAYLGETHVTIMSDSAFIDSLDAAPHPDSFQEWKRETGRPDAIDAEFEVVEDVRED